jgi:hypothetical protein
LHPILIDRQDVRSAIERRALALDIKAGAQGVLGNNAPSAVALDAAGPVLAVGGLGDAIEEKVAGGIPGGEVDTAVPTEPGNLEIDIFEPFLPGEDAEIIDLALIFIDRGGGDR